MKNGVIVPTSQRVIYRDYTWSTVDLTTRYVSFDVYYTAGDANKLNIGVDNFTPISAVVKDWSNMTSPITLYIASDSKLGAFSSASQIATQIKVRVAYVQYGI